MDILRRLCRVCGLGRLRTAGEIGQREAELPCRRIGGDERLFAFAVLLAGDRLRDIFLQLLQIVERQVIEVGV
jgi:hypothetical protein